MILVAQYHVHSSRCVQNFILNVCVPVICQPLQSLNEGLSMLPILCSNSNTSRNDQLPITKFWLQDNIDLGLLPLY